MPAQAALDARALADQVVAVVGEQAQLALGARRGAPRAGRARAGRRGRPRRRRWRRSCRACARCGASAPSASAARARRPRRAAMRKRSRRPETWRQSSRAKRRSGAEASAPRRAGARGRASVAATVSSPSELAGGGLEGHRGVALLVRVDPEYDHVLSPFGRIPAERAGPPADRPWWGPLSQAPIRSRRRTSRPAAGDTTHEGQPRRVTSSLRATPPPHRRLPDQGRESQHDFSLTPSPSLLSGAPRPHPPQSCSRGAYETCKAPTAMVLFHLSLITD